MAEDKRNINYTGLAVFYLVSVFFLIEGALRIYYAATDNIPPHSNYSVRKEWQWVTERKLSGNASFNKDFIYDKWIGWNNRANIKTDKIQTNAQHMRNSQNFNTGYHPGRRRLLILGDSFSFGYGVSNQETYAYQTADHYFPKGDVLYMSISATGTDQHIINYEHYGKQYRPETVVLGFYLLDYSRNLIRFRYYAKPKFELRSEELTLTGSPVPLLLTPPQTRKYLPQNRAINKRVATS